MKKIINFSASINARLQNYARTNNKPFQEILQYYGIERFLYRLSKTKYSSGFILKGGLVFYALGVSQRRMTRDIDFRAFIKNDKENILTILQSAFETPSADDGLTFSGDDIVIEDTMLDADYLGMRIHFSAHLGKAKIPIQVDIGFSDVITTEATFEEYPTLLEGMEPPVVKTYPIESIISEKFHAMVMLGEINSRWKDFYDVWLLSETCDIDGKSLQTAIKATFDQRETPIPAALPAAFTDNFITENQQNWHSFVTRNKLTSMQVEDLIAVIKRLDTFICPPVRSLLHSETFTKQWRSGNKWE